MINWDRVTELQDEIGEEDFLEVGRMFIAEMEEKLQDMAGSPHREAADYHYLRGSAANLGFTEFAELCGAAESAGNDGAPDNFAAIRDSFNKSLAEISDLFDA